MHVLTYRYEYNCQTCLLQHVSLKLNLLLLTYFGLLYNSYDNNASFIAFRGLKIIYILKIDLI